MNKLNLKVGDGEKLKGKKRKIPFDRMKATNLEKEVSINDEL